MLSKICAQLIVLSMQKSQKYITKVQNMLDHKSPKQAWMDNDVKVHQSSKPKFSQMIAFLTLGYSSKDRE